MKTEPTDLSEGDTARLGAAQALAKVAITCRVRLQRYG
jgi:hypothetical protein